MSSINYLKPKAIALINGNIITIDPEDRIAEAILVVGDKILAVGSNDEIKELLPNNSIIVDLEGRSVVPGLIDSHTHLELTLNHRANAVGIHTPPLTSLEQIFNKIKETVAQTPKGKWIIARGTHAMVKKVSEGRLPTIEELDLIAPENPLVVFSSLHICVMNRLAIEKMGWTHETRLPLGATLGRNHETGELTGVFTEVWDRLPLSPWGYDNLVSTLNINTTKYYVSRGFTTVHEIPHTTDGIRAWQDLYRKGDLPIRLKFYMHHPHIIDIDEFLRTGLQTGFGNDWLSIGGIKIFVDGIRYHANLHPFDDVKWTQTELNEMVLKSHRSGLQLWLHALTPTGIKMGQKALEQALEYLPRPDHRHRLEHAGDRIDDDTYNRLQSYGIIPGCTPQFYYTFTDRSGPPLRSLINRKFIFPGNTDSTGSQIESTDPWHNIWCCVQRKNLNGQVLSPTERLTPLQAIRMFSLWAAWGGFEEHIKGSIEPGKLADLVILGADPLTIDPDELEAMPVELVMIGGKAKWSSDLFKGVLN